MKLTAPRVRVALHCDNITTLRFPRTSRTRGPITEPTRPTPLHERVTYAVCVVAALVVVFTL